MYKLLSKLKDKYNMNDYTINILSKIIPALIEYNGIEKTQQIFYQLYNCNIHIKEDNEIPNEYISNYIGIKDNYIYNDNIDGYCTTRPILNNGILKTKTLIYLLNKPDMTKEYDFNLSTLVHELCHVIKTDNFKINGIHIEHTAGFQQEKYNLDGTLNDRKYIFLEESQNTCDENEINALINNIRPEDSEDRVTRYILSTEYYVKVVDVLESYYPGIKENLKNRDFNILKRTLTPEGVDKLESLLEKCFLIFNKTTPEEINEMLDIIENEYYAILDIIYDTYINNHQNKPKLY